MKKTILFSIGFMLTIGVNTAYAEIDEMAPSASHKLEMAIDEIHSYLHHHYDSSYGSHDFETLASEMHHALYEWQHGSLSEEDISLIKEDLKLSWNNFRQSIQPAQILNHGDDDLDVLFEEIKESYKHLRFLLRKSD